MNTGHTHQSYPIHPAGLGAVGRCQARRRQRLGIVLIIVGSVWLWLRLTGWVGDLPLLIGWEEGTAAIWERFTVGDLALSVPLAACGMLLPYSIYRAP